MPKRLVVADTGPLNYLVLVDAIELLPRIFEQIVIPVAVYAELAHPDAPTPVRTFIAQKPAWLEVHPNPPPAEGEVVAPTLDAGERAAIALAALIHADLILMDDRAGVAAAHQRGFTVTGTLGVLDLAARRGLIDLTTAFANLKRTNFRYPPEVMDALLARFKRGEES
jgi:predicted nucleic acid-binding protein